MIKKSYDIKLLGEVEFEDFWNLTEHPLYIKVDKRQKPYFIFNEIPQSGYEKVNSLHSIATYLRRYDWVWGDRYWESINKEVQAAINIPYTEL